MIDPVIKAAYDKYVVKLNQKIEEANAIKRTLNMLAEEAGEQPFDIEGDGVKTTTSKSIRPDQFTGKKLATSVTEIFNLYATALPLDQIIDILRSGGYRIDNEKDTKAGIQKNTTTFMLANKERSMYGLKSWYEKPKRRSTTSDITQANGEVTIEEEEIGESIEDQSDLSDS